MSENGKSLLELGTALADAIKYTVVLMNVAPIFPKNSLQLGTYPNSAALRAALLQWCKFIPKLWSESDRGSKGAQSGPSLTQK